jgi:hypothetical protein
MYNLSTLMLYKEAAQPITYENYSHMLFKPIRDKLIRVAFSTVRSESLCALRLRYVDLVVSIEVSVEVCCYFTVFSC